MMLIDEFDYGPLSDLVSVSGSIIAAGSAITLGWRKRAKWEPSEEDIAKGPERVGSLLTAVIIAILWLQMRNPTYQPFLAWLAIAMAIACVFFLSIYGFLIAMQTYEILYSPGPNAVSSRKIIGGFSLLTHAKEIKLSEQITTQDLLAGMAYDADKVWTRQSRALAKSSFVICYLGLTVSGTVALACVAIILGLSRQP